MYAQISGGILLLLATVAAMVWANSPWAESYNHLQEHRITTGVVGNGHYMSLHR